MSPTAATTSGVENRPDLVLHAGRIWTGRGCPVDEGPSALAIRSGTVIAVGGEDLLDLAGPDTRVVDLGGRRVVPGLIDSHLHAVRGGLSWSVEIDLTMATCIDDVLAAIREAAGRRNPGAWICALGGFHPGQLRERRMPTPGELDQAAPDHPVFLHPVYGTDEPAVLNSAGMAAMGWAGACDDPPGGTLYRDAAGVPDGRLEGVGSFQTVIAAAVPLDTERVMDSSLAFFEHLASLGITGVVDAGGLGMTPDRYASVRSLWRASALPIRLRLFVGATVAGEEEHEVEGWQTYLAPGFGDEWMSFAGVGEALNYACHDWEGMAPIAPNGADVGSLERVLARSAELGWTVTIHAILKESIDRILDVMEKIDAQRSIASLRWSLCHVECASEASLDRIAALGLGVTLQSRIAHKGEVCADRWGEDIFVHAPPIADIRARGIPIGGGTDGTRAASYNPWMALKWFVTGECFDNGPRRDKRHRLDRAEALDIYTRGSAWFTFEESRRGALEPGFAADLAVLSSDYFTVPETEIPGLRSEFTVVGGRVVCDRLGPA